MRRLYHFFFKHILFLSICRSSVHQVNKSLQLPVSIMCDLSQDGLWESDNAPDFSSLTRRIDSFRGSNLANKVPAETLAQAGFFYTGESDLVRCFSCNMTVDNWYSGDRPVDKHKQVIKLVT